MVRRDSGNPRQRYHSPTPAYRQEVLQQFFNVLRDNASRSTSRATSPASPNVISLNSPPRPPRSITPMADNQHQQGPAPADQGNAAPPPPVDPQQQLQTMIAQAVSVMVQATSFDHVTINNQTNDVRLRQDVCLAVVSASKRCLS